MNIIKIPEMQPITFTVDFVLLFAIVIIIAAMSFFAGYKKGKRG